MPHRKASRVAANSIQGQFHSRIALHCRTKTRQAPCKELPDVRERVPVLFKLQFKDQPHPPFVLDVRSEKEYDIVHVNGSHNIPLTHLHEHLSEVPLDRSVVVHCEGGYRSAIACSLLAKAGLTNLKDLVGGIKAWIATKLPTVPENTMTCGTKICETAA